MVKGFTHLILSSSSSFTRSFLYVVMKTLRRISGREGWKWNSKRAKIFHITTANWKEKTIFLHFSSFKTPLCVCAALTLRLTKPLNKHSLCSFVLYLFVHNRFLRLKIFTRTEFLKLLIFPTFVTAPQGLHVCNNKISLVLWRNLFEVRNSLPFHHTPTFPTHWT